MTNPPASDTKKRGLFYGWWIVVASAVTFIWGGGAFSYSFTAFFKPIVDEFGWSRALTSFAFSLRSFETGLLDPFIGIIIDRIGPRKMILFGVLLMGVGVFWLGRIDSLFSFYAAFLVASLGLAAGFSLAQYAAIANWFVRKRARSMAILSAGYGISGLLTPGMVWLIQTYGWRTAFDFVAVGTFVICVPLALVVRTRPEDSGLLPDGDSPITNEDISDQPAFVGTSAPSNPENIGYTAMEALKTRAFWQLFGWTALVGFATSAMFPHIIPYLVSIGIPEEYHGWAVTGITMSSLIGRVGLGSLGDFYDKRYIIAGANFLQLVGVLIFAFMTEAWHLIPFALLFGPGYAAPIPLRPALQADYFGGKAFATIAGLLIAGWTVSGVIAPPFAGWVFDVWGTYRPAFIILAVTTALGIPTILTLKAPKPIEED
jgi:MFS family permease